MITIAISKGRLEKDSFKLFSQIGVSCSEYRDSSRKLIFLSEDQNISFIRVKPSDVPTYVEYGAADIGIVGKDTLLEERKELYELLDLKFGNCILAVAGLKDKKTKSIANTHIKVATKYPNIAQDFFAKKGQQVEIIKLNGSVELAPIIGLSDVIVDIVESGRTLKENGLTVLNNICSVTARLVVNQVSLKTKREEIKSIWKNLESVLEEDLDDQNNRWAR